MKRLKNTVRILFLVAAFTTQSRPASAAWYCNPYCNGGVRAAWCYTPGGCSEEGVEAEAQDCATAAFLAGDGAPSFIVTQCDEYGLSTYCSYNDPSCYYP
jgi:hypothetical protein